MGGQDPRPRTDGRAGPAASRPQDPKTSRRELRRRDLEDLEGDASIRIVHRVAVGGERALPGFGDKGAFWVPDQRRLDGQNVEGPQSVALDLDVGRRRSRRDAVHLCDDLAVEEIEEVWRHQLVAHHQAGS